MISLQRYRLLLAEEGLAYVFTASLVGRLPIGMSGLAILLLVQGARDSFALGGIATGVYVAGLAAMAPVLGRLIDRHGPRWVLLACAALFPASMAALVAAVSVAAPSAAILACAAAAGMSFPPMTVCMRTFLRQRLRDDTSLHAAYALDSVLIEVMFIAGPMLVALFVAFASGAAAVLFAAACALVGVGLFLPALRAWRIEPRQHATLLGPLGQASFLGLIAIVLCYCIAFGLTELGAAAFAAELNQPALAGVFLGVMSAGSALGGLAYGSRGWHAPLLRQFGTTLAVMGIGLLVLGMVAWPPLVFGALCFFAGVVMAPALIIQSMLVAKVARPEQMTEAFTWSTSALLGGVGLGMAIGGALVELWHSPMAFLAGGAAALAAAAGAFWLSRR
ncbi:MAG TPA: MFS transporter [Burkholderiales bacterium]|nr:MFS transporter [Burkholderiales bacterium]